MTINEKKEHALKNMDVFNKLAVNRILVSDNLPKKLLEIAVIICFSLNLLTYTFFNMLDMRL